MWNHLKVCKKISFVVDKKQKGLVLEPKKKGESEDQNVGTLKVIGYNYCRTSAASRRKHPPSKSNLMCGKCVETRNSCLLLVEK